MAHRNITFVLCNLLFMHRGFESKMNFEIEPSYGMGVNDYVIGKPQYILVIMLV